jgi:signal transduction histidine kinase
MVLALPAVVLVPAIHFVTIQLEGGLSGVAALRLRATLLTTALLGGLFLMRQIHVLKRVEEASRREMEMRQRLLRAERVSAIGMLVAGVAHEINNPLAVVVGQAEVLGRRVSDDANRSRIDAIRDNAERCGRIVRNLLLFARGSSAERGVVNLAELVRQVGELETHDLSMRNIVLELGLYTQDHRDPARPGCPIRVHDRRHRGSRDLALPLRVRMRESPEALCPRGASRRGREGAQRRAKRRLIEGPKDLPLWTLAGCGNRANPSS